MTVTGDYHGVATFFESVAGLNRIVTIKNIDMKPDKESTSLTTTCTAVTYKFIEASDAETKTSKKSNKKKKR
jgi:type IV pilus assembly protein PilO